MYMPKGKSIAHYMDTITARSSSSDSDDYENFIISIDSDFQTSWIETYDWYMVQKV
jgi:hypothetical protein